ncbi:MAG: ABC transporter substrate-binding protein, partial [Lachnospiraceae bacterium]|nr:ABC transporter substrate-binding protein [Lachnospiraceae bacterium]
YVEEETDLSEQTTFPMDLCIREDGSLVILDRNTGMLVSRDQGVTWESEMPEWYMAMREEGTYINSMCMAPDGTVVAITADMGSSAQAEESDGQDAADSENSEEQGEGADSTDGSETSDGESDADDDESEEESSMFDDPFNWSYYLTLFLPDGTEIPVTAKLTEEEMHFEQVAFNTDNRIFASTYRGIYEIQRDGSAEKILTLDYNPQWIWVRDNLLVIDSAWDEADTPAVYDLEAKAFIPDEVLTEFVDSNYDDRYFNGRDYATMFLLPGEDSTVYVVGKRGIHRHVVGGNMMEQIVDGNLSQLINPNYCITDMVQLESGVFMALFSNSKVLRFTYDPNIPSVPENILTLYSLKEEDSIRQAISHYQTEHSDVFVSYQVGMGGDSSVTREDAIKKLNTEIMAGEGPDLLVMDGLPLDSYIEKGLLVDMTDYLAEYGAKEPLFDNIIDALARDGKAYVVPATVSVPKIAAASDGMENVTDMSDIAKVVEKLREEYPTKNILGVSGERGILKRFVGVSEPKWVAADGSIDKDVIGGYLEQCKRIFDAQMDGLDEKVISYYEQRNEWTKEYSGLRMDETDWSVNMDIMSYVGSEQHMIAGWVDAAYNYMQIMSLDRVKGLEEAKVVPMKGQCGNVFEPYTMLGISAASEQSDLAYGFLDVFLSVEAQSAYGGLPLSQAAFDKQFTPQEEYLGADGGYGGVCTMAVSIYTSPSPR